MILRLLYFCCFISLAGTAFAQKTAYIPNYLLNPNDVNGAQFTWSKTRQSANFTLIWGNTVGTDPANHPDPNLRFNPDAMLDTMETIYTAFKDLGFVDDAAGTNLSQYKIPIVVYGTWGPNGAQGFANGGDADGVIGAFWVHPAALQDGGVAAHELVHSLQAQCNIDYRATNGLGLVWLNAGIFWETHANFMRNLLYPRAVSAWGMDVYHIETWGDWKNTYENYELLFAIMESEGIGMINRLWREAYSWEYPLQTYKRLAGYNQSQFNDSLFHYARRMATFDFNYNHVGTYFRQYRNSDLMYQLPSAQATYSILKKIPGAENRYEIPIELAPEEFAYNVIPLYPETDSCAVIIKFKGHTEANAHTGWRYGFAAARADGTLSRYSPTYSENTGEINFRLEGDETRLFLVVMGAPFDEITTNTTNDTWQGYPKHFRFPYELNISGAKPEGFQAPENFRAQLKIDGHLHPNGGGWVQNSANVANSVYVGPTAIVLGNANISGQVRIENTAIVRHATLSGNVRVRNNALVDRGNYSGDAVIQGQGFAENVTMSENALIGMRGRVSNYNLSGNVEVGGDVIVYNENGSCDNGVHYRLTNYYDNKLLECDGRTASHPVNLDVNNSYALFSNEAMSPQCSCAFQTSPILVDSVAIAPVSCTNALAGKVEFYISRSCGPFQYAWSKGAENGSNLNGLAAGNYTFSITDALGREIVLPVEVPAAPELAVSVLATDYDCTNGLGATATVELLGGSAPIDYAWDNGANTASIADLGPGLYVVTSTDAQGCSAVASVQVGISGELNTALITMPISCHASADGTAVVTPINGTAPFAWLWQGGETESGISNLAAGDYAITIVDAFGCFDQQQFSLTAPDALDLTLEGPAALCVTQEGNLEALVAGGVSPYLYDWSNDLTDANISVLGSGTFTLTVTDAHGCTVSNTLEIEPGEALHLVSSSASVQCFDSADGMAAVESLNGTAPFTWIWNTGQTDSLLTDLAAGSYFVTVTDANGCSAFDVMFISSPTPIYLHIDGPSILCPETEGEISVMASGGTSPYTYQWNTGFSGATLLSMAGTFTVSVTDAQACVQTQTLEIPEATEVTAQFEIQQATAAMVEDGSILVTDISGGVAPYTFAWSNGSTTQSLENIPPGDYTLSITDATGCVWIFTHTVGFATSANDLKNPGIQALVTPNPSSATAHLWLEMQEAQSLEIRISDAMGRIIYTKTELFKDGKSLLPLPEMRVAGVYWVQVMDRSGVSLVIRWVVIV
jgi:hypothetical protein